MLIETDIARLRELDRPRQAAAILTGEIGPLVGLGFEADVAAMAYLIHLARRRARMPGGMLSGRPGYEADDTLRGRVLSVAESSGSLPEFADALFERLNLHLAQLPAVDLLWWRSAASTMGDRWHHLSTTIALTEALTGAKILDDTIYQLKENANNAQ
jgi:hypothetical protein